MDDQTKTTNLKAISKADQPNNAVLYAFGLASILYVLSAASTAIVLVWFLTP